MRTTLIEPIKLSVSPSHYYLGWISLMSVSVTAGLLWASIPWALFLLIGALWHTLALNGWCPHIKKRIEQVALSAHGELSVYLEEKWLPASVQDDCIVLPFLIVLHLEVNQQHHRLALFADSAPPDALRQLRVYLRWFRRQKTEDRRQKTEDRRQKTEDRRQKTEVWIEQRQKVQ